MARIRVVLLALLCSGCAARKNVGSPGRIVIPDECLKSINIVPGKTHCDKPIDGKDGMSCHGATVTYEPFCGPKLVVIKSKGKTK